VIFLGENLKNLQGRFFRCGHLHFLEQKTSDFKFVVCPHGQREKGVEPVRTYADKRVNFSRFFADIFYGRPLTMYQLCLFAELCIIQQQIGPRFSLFLF